MKEHEHQLVAICDQNLLGKTLRGEVGIEIKIEPRFYGERLVTEKEVVSALRSSRILNLFGKEITALALQEGVIKRENIRNIQGVPHAQVVRI